MIKAKEKEENIKEIEDEKKVDDKPFLLTRFGAGLFDFLIAAICTLLIQTAFQFTLFKPFGYNEKMDVMHQKMEDSHLYAQDSASYYEITNIFDDKKDSLKEQYDDRIIYYYTHDERAIENRKLDEFNKNKDLYPELFKFNEEKNEYEFVSSEKESDVIFKSYKTFFEKEYQNALSFFSLDPTYNAYHRQTFLIYFTFLGISILISGGIFYLLVPLLMKNGETIFKKVFKLGLIDDRTGKRVKKKQIIIRFVVFMIISFYMPFFIEVVFNYFTLIPTLATILVLCVTRKNKGIHDYAAQTMIVSRRNREIEDDVVNAEE